MYVRALRDLLPAAKDSIFLNYAATAPMLQTSADYMSGIIQEGTAPLSQHFDKWLGIVESARKSVADLIGASTEEVAFTTNTSSALSLIAASIEWKEGDRVLFPSDEFPSNRYVWQNLKTKGVCAESFDVNIHESLVEKLSSMDLQRVKLVSVSAVSYLNGRKYHIGELVQFCHDRNILVAIDAIQAVGAVAVNVHDWGCDFLACGGQKWLLGPVGSGFLYIKKDHLKKLHIPMVGWASAKDAGDFDVKQLEFVDGARRYEPGLSDVAAIAGLWKSIETFQACGLNHIFQTIKSHHQTLRNEIEKFGYEVLNRNCEEDNAGIVSVNLSNHEESGIHDLLQKNNIIVTQRKSILRISVHAATSDEDIHSVVNVLAKAKGKKVVVGVSRESETIGKSFKNENRLQMALVTGASRGLGKGIAFALAKRGCHLHLMGTDMIRLDQVAKEIRAKYDVNIETIGLNFCNRTEVEGWLNQNQSILAYDILVNNAVMGVADLFLETDIQHVRDVFQVNFFTPYLFMQKILPGMIERDKGAILNVVTSGSRCALPLFAEYSASKGALWSLSETLGRELAGLGVSVTTFLPPHMETATANRLGRKALGYYKMGNVRSHTASALAIGEKAVEALFAKKKTVVPFGVRFKLAINSIFPNIISRKIQDNWKGLVS